MIITSGLEKQQQQEHNMSLGSFCCQIRCLIPCYSELQGFMASNIVQHIRKSPEHQALSLLFLMSRACSSYKDQDQSSRKSLNERRVIGEKVAQTEREYICSIQGGMGYAPRESLPCIEYRTVIHQRNPNNRRKPKFIKPFYSVFFRGLRKHY